MQYLSIFCSLCAPYFLSTIITLTTARPPAQISTAIVSIDERSETAEITELGGSGMRITPDCRARPWCNSSGSVTVKTSSYVLTTLTGITVCHEKLMPNVRFSLITDAMLLVPDRFVPKAVLRYIGTIQPGERLLRVNSSRQQIERVSACNCIWASLDQHPYSTGCPTLFNSLNLGSPGRRSMYPTCLLS